MPPTTGQNCFLRKNETLAPTGTITPSPNQVQTGKRTGNPEDWVQSLTHLYGTSCIDLGSLLADLLLGPGGLLDDTGAGTFTLASCQNPNGCSLTTPQPVSLLGTNWQQGYITVTDDVFQVAYCVAQSGLQPRDCLQAMELPIPGSGNIAHSFWYGPDATGYWFQFWWVADGYTARGGECVSVPTPITVYWVDTKTSAAITCLGGYAPAMDNPNAPGVTSYGWYVDSCCGLPTAFSQFRGAGGANPSSVPNLSKAQAKQWALSQPWSTLKPKMDSALRAVKSWRAALWLGITGNPNFECKDVVPPGYLGYPYCRAP
jgi:hypothetical protein